MRILVIGAGGGLGRAVVEQLLDEGHNVRAFARRPAPAVADHGQRGRDVEAVCGDARDSAALAAAMTDQDVVVNAIGSGTLRRNTVESDTTRTALETAGRLRLRRYIGLSAGMVAPVSPMFDHLIRPTLFANLYREHLAVERLIRASGLDWTIVRPTKLGDKPAAGYRESNATRPRGPIVISRADVAEFIAREIRDNRYIKQAVFLVSASRRGRDR